jgi:liver stage antigen 3, putative
MTDVLNNVELTDVAEMVYLKDDRSLKFYQTSMDNMKNTLKQLEEKEQEKTLPEKDLNEKHLDKVKKNLSKLENVEYVYTNETNYLDLGCHKLKEKEIMVENTRVNDNVLNGLINELIVAGKLEQKNILTLDLSNLDNLDNNLVEPVGEATIPTAQEENEVVVSPTVIEENNEEKQEQEFDLSGYLKDLEKEQEKEEEVTTNAWTTEEVEKNNVESETEIDVPVVDQYSEIDNNNDNMFEFTTDLSKDLERIRKNVEDKEVLPQKEEITEDEELDVLLDKISSLEEQENTIELNVKKLEEARLAKEKEAREAEEREKELNKKLSDMIKFYKDKLTEREKTIAKAEEEAKKLEETITNQEELINSKKETISQAEAKIDKLTKTMEKYGL